MSRHALTPSDALAPLAGSAAPPPILLPPPVPTPPPVFTPPPVPVPPEAPLDESEEEELPLVWSQLFAAWITSSLTSVAVHLLILLALSLLVIVGQAPELVGLVVSPAETPVDLDAGSNGMPSAPPDGVAHGNSTAPEAEPVPEMGAVGDPLASELAAEPGDLGPGGGNEISTDIAHSFARLARSGGHGPPTSKTGTLAPGDPSLVVGLGGGVQKVLANISGLGGRTTAGRAQLVRARGGTPGSEAAVENGLYWLMLHQREDGGWSFDQTDICQGACRNNGVFPSRNAATALALLPFLGAGYTHKSGPYQQVVGKGLYFLQRAMRENGDLHENSMYTQGLATIALCEAYAMTKDPSIRPFAQEAVSFIVRSQHNAGGWRYTPGEPGDTTVTGWQLMALKSAQLGGLEVPSITFSRVSEYLDSVQSHDGTVYGYQRSGDRPPGNRQEDPTTTAIGLLCRMYTGWPRDKRPLIRGVSQLESHGPSRNDMYFNYNATQVMQHFGGSSWKHWNAKLRDKLVKSQDTLGHERGSWYLEHAHAHSGGRLYCTAMACMTLEVYYRYMPIYKSEKIVGF